MSGRRYLQQQQESECLKPCICKEIMGLMKFLKIVYDKLRIEYTRFNNFM